MSTPIFRKRAHWRLRAFRRTGFAALLPPLLLLPLLFPSAGHAQQPTPQQQNAIRQSCRADFQANCAGVPAGGAEALQCLKQNYAKASPACQQALAPVGGGASAPASAAPATSPPAGPAKSPPAASSGGQGMAAQGGGNPPALREEMMLTREWCAQDFRAYCANVPLGGGRAVQCLEANAASLSPGCKRALMEMRQRK